METYSLMRQFADSWMLLAMFTFFAAAAIWAFWPGLNRSRDDAASIPFRNDGAAASAERSDAQKETVND